MLHRLNPPNAGQWNGVGGRIEPGETALENIVREVYEETGYRIRQVQFRGVLTWRGHEEPEGGLYLFTAAAPDGEPGSCDEGTLAWKPLAWVWSDPGVVSNIPLFAPQVLDGAPPRVYDFTYDGERIVSHRVYSLPVDADALLNARRPF